MTESFTLEAGHLQQLGLVVQKDYSEVTAIPALYT